MNWRKIVSFGLLFWLVTAQAGGTEPRTLCFFSLNNSKEFELTRSILGEAKRLGGSAIHVVELHDPRQDANPASSFKKMLESRQTCDGLVISGHHTGSFGGNRAKGVLNIGFLEQMSCDPEYEDFFQQVKGLWLQGCRTLGVGPLGLEMDNTDELQADYHMQRVGAELLQDGLEQGFAELSFEFSSTLDQDNPLASRYLRVFPAANVFGWTKSSPGVKAQSEKSLLYHMAHMSHLSQDIPLFDPLKGNNLSRKADMSQSLWKILEGNSSYGSLAREAWLSHGNVTKSGLGFNNPDLNAYIPLLLSSQDSLLAAKALGCKLRNAPNFGELQSAFTRILLSQDHVAYNLNVIWEAFQRYGEKNPSEYDVLRNQLVTSVPLMNLLSRKLKSPQAGLLMKIEYYSFYKELTGYTLKNVEALILERVRYFLLARDLAGSAYDIRDFRESLLASVASHQLADTSFYRELVHAPDVRNSTLYALTWSFLKQPPQEAELVINDIINHPKAKSDTLRAAAIWVMTHGTSEQFDILKQIVAHPRVDEATLETVASILTIYKLQASAELVKVIVPHPKTGGLALRQVSLAIRKYNIDVGKSVLEDILSHPSVDRWGLQTVAWSITNSSGHTSSYFLWEIVNHEQVDANILSTVAIALKNSDYGEKSELLYSIRAHPRSDARTLKYVDRALAEGSPKDQEEQFF